MSLRANYIDLAPEAMQILMNQERYLREQFHTSETVTIAVWESVKLRVSQINQCAFREPLKTILLALTSLKFNSNRSFIAHKPEGRPRPFSSNFASSVLRRLRF